MLNIQTWIRTNLNTSKWIRSRIRSENIRTVFTPDPDSHDGKKRSGASPWHPAYTQTPDGGAYDWISQQEGFIATSYPGEELYMFFSYSELKNKDAPGQQSSWWFKKQKRDGKNKLKSKGYNKLQIHKLKIWDDLELALIDNNESSFAKEKKSPCVMEVWLNPFED